MQIKIFHIGISENEEELNKFLRSHKILTIDKQYDPNLSHWTFAISYMENGVLTKKMDFKSEKVDYKNLLTEDEFQRFTNLRLKRKKIANEEALPAYAIFTDKELAQIATIINPSHSDITRIDGINTARATRFGERLLTDETTR